MSNFDGLQVSAFKVVENLYGDTAIWSSSSLSELVLFKNPNEPINIGDTNKYEYRPYNFSLEFFNTQFVGLKELVDGGSEEKITCKGFNLVVKEVVSKFDGKTLVAYCEEEYIEPIVEVEETEE